MLSLHNLNFSFLYGPYSIVAYLATASALVYARNRHIQFSSLSKNLNGLPEEDKLHALELAYGPIPKEITAEEWIRDRKNLRLFLSFLTVVISLIPIVLFTLEPDASDQIRIAKKIFNLPEGSEAKTLTKQKSPTLAANHDGGGNILIEMPSDNQGEGEEDHDPDHSQSAGSANNNKKPAEATKSAGQPGGEYIGSSITGILQYVTPVNRAVKAKDVIAKIECKDIEAERKAAWSNWIRSKEAAKAQESINEYTILQLEVDSAEAAHQKKDNRLKLLKSLGESISQNEVELALNEERLAQADLNIAQERRKMLDASFKEKMRSFKNQANAARDQLEIIDARLSHCVIRSPINGVVVSAKIKGDRVTPGISNPIVILRGEETKPAISSDNTLAQGLRRPMSGTHRK